MPRRASQSLKTSPADTAAGRVLDADCVYFLMYSGWATELRSNRWHYASRWARLLPVVLVQPNLKKPQLRGESEAEPRIQNCRVLRVLAPGDPADNAITTLVQAGQVMDDMGANGYRRPILWFYNPHLAGLYASVPAAARIYHATENYFDFEGLEAAFIRQMEAAILMSDLVIAVSSGVADRLHHRVPSARMLTLTNGCDFRHYSAGSVDPALVELGSTFERTAVYAGNINSRVDFDLLLEAALAQPHALIALFGPVAALSTEDQGLWDRLLKRPNVRYLGSLDPDCIRDVYAAADVGLIPYKQEPWLVENGFPLKALEMAAAGLPVVSSLMKPIRNLAEALVVTDGREAFLAALAASSRGALSPAALRELKAVAAANDYDSKFAVVRAELGRLAPRTDPQTRIDSLTQATGADWTASQARLLRAVVRPPSQPLRKSLFLAVADRIPTPARRVLPQGLRTRVKQMVGLG